MMVLSEYAGIFVCKKAFDAHKMMTSLSSLDSITPTTNVASEDAAGLVDSSLLT